MPYTPKWYFRAGVWCCRSKSDFRLLVFYYVVAYRLDNFVVGLTNAWTSAPVFNTSYTLCAQYSGSVAPGESATVFFAPSSQKFRIVIVQGSLTTVEALCLTEVSVYAAERDPPRKWLSRSYCYCQDCDDWKCGTWKSIHTRTRLQDVKIHDTK